MPIAKGQRLRPASEKMKIVTFNIKPSDYERAVVLFESLGLPVGAGIRMALLEYLSSRDPNKAK